MSRTHPFDPLIPAITLGRVTSGAVGGVVGGLLFGAMMFGNFAITNDIGNSGMVPQLQEILGTTSAGQVWALHMAMSIGIGLVFSFFIAPHSYRSSILWSLGTIMVLGFLLSQVVLRRLTDVPLVFDSGAAFALVGHLVYGLGLGIVYVAFHNLEIREALDAESAKWRAWGERERES